MYCSEKCQKETKEFHLIECNLLSNVYHWAEFSIRLGIGNEENLMKSFTCQQTVLRLLIKGLKESADSVTKLKEKLQSSVTNKGNKFKYSSRRLM